MQGPRVFQKHFQVLDAHVASAIVYSAHGKGDCIVDMFVDDRNGSWLIWYANGYKVNVEAKMVLIDAHAKSTAEAQAHGKIRKLTSSFFSELREVPMCVCTLYIQGEQGFIGQQFQSMPRKYDLIALYGRYKDIVTCAPGGPRFRDKHGNVCGNHVTTNALFFEE